MSGLPAQSQAPTPADDAPLVARAQAGDWTAFEWLVVKYRRRVERLLERYVRDPHTAQDLAQETFLKAFRGLPQFRGESQFYTWLYRIAVQTAQAYFQKHRLERAHTAQPQPDEDDAETFWRSSEPSTADTPETLLAAKELAQAVNEAMERLPAEFRQALTLRELEGMSYEAIGEVMGCPPGTVRSRIYRAREAVSAHIRPLLQRQTGKRW